MKRLIVLCVAIFTGCSQQKPTYRNVKLVTDSSWPIGEARWCSGFDGQWNEIHCFPPEKLSAHKTDYLVDVYSDGPMHFDAQQWAYDIYLPIRFFQERYLSSSGQQKERGSELKIGLLSIGRKNTNGVPSTGRRSLEPLPLTRTFV